GAHDDHRPGDVAAEDLLLVAHHVLAELDPGQGLDHGAGGDDAVVERIRRAVDLDGLGVGEPAVPVDLVRLVLLRYAVYALGHPVGHLAAAVVRGAVVHGDVAGDAEGLGVAGHDVGELGVPQQRLGGDTPDVEADAAPVSLLDYGH